MSAPQKKTEMFLKEKFALDCFDCVLGILDIFYF